MPAKPDVDMSPHAVSSRLREMSRLRGRFAVLPEVDMSPRAITSRLRTQSELRRSCLALMEIGRRAGLHDRRIEDEPHDREPVADGIGVQPIPCT